MGIQITPSILNADLSRLADEVARIPSADWVHVDVMDNHFVPNLTLGLPVIEALGKHASQPLDAHLMIEDADRWAPGLRRGRLRVGHLPRRGDQGAGAARPRDPGPGRTCLDGAQAGDADRALRRRCCPSSTWC